MKHVGSHAAFWAAIATGVLLGAGGAAAAPPPPPTITSHPPDPSHVDTATFGFSDDDPTATFECRLDSADPAAFQPCPNPATTPPLADGVHAFDVRAVNADGPGGRAPIPPFTWTIDTTRPPPPSITAKPGNPSNDSDPSFSFTDAKRGVTFQCRRDSQQYAQCKSPKTYAGLTSGDHVFRVRAVDQAGRMSEVTRYSWSIDLAPPPAPTIGGRPANPTTATDATFGFTDSEAGVTFRCELDGGGYSACASPAVYSGLTLIPHVFSVRAVDTAGNIGPPASIGWTIVAAAPDTTAPGEVGSVRRSIGYGRFKLVWSRPKDGDFDHVRVLIATARKGSKAVPRKVVYNGRGTQYTNKRFKNDVYHRYRILSYDHRGNRSRGVDVVVAASALLRLPKPGAVVHAPPRLVWAGVAKAAFYNVQIYFSGRKVLSLWPNKAAVGLKKRWSYSGRTFRLKKGTYSWFVWPAFNSRQKARYGRLLGMSTFRVR
jgi:hypothetical protein